MRHVVLLGALLASYVMSQTSVWAQVDAKEEALRQKRLMQEEMERRKREVRRRWEEKRRQLRETTTTAQRDKDAPAWSTVIGRQLDATKVTFDFRDADLTEVAAYLARKGGINLWVDPRHSLRTDAAGKIGLTLSLTDATLRDAIARVARSVGLKTVILDGMVLLTDREIGPVTWPALRDGINAALDDTLVSFDFAGQPLSLVLPHLGEIANLDLRPGGNAGRHAITLRAQRMRLRHLLNWIARFEGMRVTHRGDAVILEVVPLSPDALTRRRLRETIVSFTFNEQPVHEAFDFLQTLGNVNIVIDRGHLKKPGQTVTLKLINVPLETAVRLCVEQLNLDYTLRGGIVYISDKATLAGIAAKGREIARRAVGKKLQPPDAKTLRKLQQTIISFTFNDQPVADAFDFLQTLGGVNIVIDRKHLKLDGKTVTLKLSNVPLATALILCAEQFSGRCALRDGLVFISDAKTVAERGGTELVIDDGKPVKRLNNATIVNFALPDAPPDEPLAPLRHIPSLD